MAEPFTLRPYDPNWAAKYHAERERLLKALGDVTEGGVLDLIAHIGSTSIPGLSAKPCIDIMVRAYPLPLPDEWVRAVTDLGYEHLGEHGIPDRHYFRKGPDDYHLHVVPFDTDFWPRHLVFRDYLRVNADARERYQAQKRELAARYFPPRSPEDRAAYQEGKAPLIELLEEEAFAWHLDTTGFTPVLDIARELADLTCPWFVSSGWALDLFLGEPSRYHEDLDIVIARDDQLQLQKYMLARGWRLHEMVSGNYAAWEPGVPIALSSHQVHARREEEFIDFLFESREGDQWLYRRQQDIRVPLAEVGMRFEGIPYLVPEIVLLFKSRSSLSADGGPRDKDEADFERVWPHLSAKRRSWLRQAVATFKPDHPWLDRLEIEQDVP